MAKTVIALEATMNASGAEGSVKSLKAQLREAQAEVGAMADKFGLTSDQAQKAAKKAAELKDAIGDAKLLTDAFNPDAKFKSFSNAINGVVGGFTALQGAQALFGDQSEDLAKTLAKVQGAMALSQGIDSILEAADAFKILGGVAVKTFNTIKTAIGSTGLGVLVLVIGSIVTALMDYVDESSKVEDATKRMKKEEEDYKTALENTTREIENRNNLTEYQLQLDLSNARARGASLKELRKIEADYWYKKRLDAQTDFTDAQDEVDRLKSLGYVKGELLNAANKDLETKRKAYYTTNQQYNLAIAKQNEEDYNNSHKLNEKKKDNNKELIKSKEDDFNAATWMREQEYLQELSDYNKRQEIATNFNNTLQLLNQNRTQNELAEANRRIANAEVETTMKRQLILTYADALGSLSQLVGSQTAAGKALAIAQIAIGTATGYVQGLDIAQKSAKATGPGAAFAFPIFYATQIAAVLGAAAKAKSILSAVKGGGNLQIPAPPSPTTAAPIGAQMGSTALQQAQINAAGSAAVQAFVLESDVSGNQERIERLNRAARIQ